MKKALSILLSVLLIASLAACASPAAENEDPNTTDAPQTTEAPDATESPDPAAEAQAQSYDVIVVGAGLSGMVSAIRAAELGGNVLLLEQSGHMGGSSMYSTNGYVTGAGTKIQSDAGVEDSADKFYDEVVGYVGTEDLNTELLRFFCENSGAAVDWLDEDLGIDFGDRECGYGNYVKLATPRVYAPVGGFPAVDAKLQERIEANAEEGNILTLMETMATSVTTDDAGAVTGVTATGKDGQSYTFQAPAVILATGGYGYSESLLKEYNFTNVASHDPNTAIGSGYEMALALGATVSNMDYCNCYGGTIPDNGFDSQTTVDISYPGFVWVDNTGARLADEMAADREVKSNTWTNAPENYVYIIIDEKMIEADYKFYSKAPDDAEANKAKLDQYVADGYAFHSGDLRDLAEQMGIDADGFVATMEQYNADCDAGKDSVFGRTDSLIKFDSGSYYAIPTIPYVLMTFGGINVDTDTRVLKEDGSAIPGLYATGELIGTSNIIGHMTIGGIGHGVCTTFGLKAAETAMAQQ